MLIEDLLELVVQPLPFRQQVVELHLAEHGTDGLSRQRQASFSEDSSNCAVSRGPRVIIFDQGARSNPGSCQGSGSTAIALPTVRLAEPLSGEAYRRSSDSTRYSF